MSAHVTVTIVADSFDAAQEAIRSLLGAAEPTEWEIRRDLTRARNGWEVLHNGVHKRWLWSRSMAAQYVREVSA